jgi:hypothetical protein
MDQFWKIIGSVFQRAGGHPNATRFVLWLVVIAPALLFLGWLIYSLANVSTSNFLRLRSRVAWSHPTTIETWRDWVEQARGTAARGEYRDAIRIIYGAALRRLADAGTWQFDPSRTHREYVRLLPATSLQRPSFLAISNCFERVWYGQALASAGDFESALADLESLA